MDGQQTYTLSELDALIQKHASIEDFTERALDAPPRIEVRRRCRTCGKFRKPFVLGWQEIQWAVAHSELPPDFMDVRMCEVCEDAENED